MPPLDAEPHHDVHSSGDRATTGTWVRGAASSKAQILIRRLSRNHDLSRQERLAIADALEDGPVLDAGAVIDSAVSRLVVLTSGLVVSPLSAPSGERAIGAIYVPGDILNLPCFMLHQDGYVLAAASECEIALLPADKVARLMQDYPGV